MFCLAAEEREFLHWATALVRLEEELSTWEEAGRGLVDSNFVLLDHGIGYCISNYSLLSNPKGTFLHLWMRFDLWNFIAKLFHNIAPGYHSFLFQQETPHHHDDLNCNLAMLPSNKFISLTPSSVDYFPHWAKISGEKGVMMARDPCKTKLLWY